MSMGKQWHQLERSESAFVRSALGALLAVIAGAACFWLDGAACILFAALIVAALMNIAHPERAAIYGRLARRALLPVTVGMLALDVFAGSRPLVAMGRVLILFLIMRTCGERGLAEERQIAGAGLALVAAGGLAAGSTFFALHLATFVSVALLLLMLGAISVHEKRAEHSKRWLHVVVRDDWRLWIPGLCFFAAVAGGGSMLFFSAPRQPAGKFPLMERYFERYGGGSARSGFSGTMHFEGVSQIREDDSVAFRVDFGRAGVPAGPLYWRMVAMDEYRNHEFRLSAGLRSAAFGPLKVFEDIKTGAPPRGGEWTFYLEPGGGKFLPMPERFQTVRYAKSVGRGKAFL